LPALARISPAGVYAIALATVCTGGDTADLVAASEDARRELHALAAASQIDDDAEVYARFISPQPSRGAALPDVLVTLLPTAAPAAVGRVPRRARRPRSALRRHPLLLLLRRAHRRATARVRRRRLRRLQRRRPRSRRPTPAARPPRPRPAAPPPPILNMSCRG